MSETEEKDQQNKKQEYKMITIEMWDTLLHTLSLLAIENEQNKSSIKDLYNQLEDIKNETSQT
tara:strand:+ start:579 stop:767 length:189 start_codon:yes stop_codon:yes gene_type:complete